MEDILRAVILGVVQGLTEFLPISSSGHLIVVRELFGWEFVDDLTFDVALHVGTTAAVVSFFWREWLEMLGRAASRLAGRRQAGPGDPAGLVYDERLLLLLAIGSAPAAAVGLVFDLFLEDETREPVIVGAMLIAGAAVMLAADRLAGGGRRRIGDARLPDAALIGAAQATALVPGVSRSGATISAGMALGFSRYEAARFSFLLSTPAILGAGLLKGAEAAAEGIPAGDLAPLAVGAAVSAAVGWLSIAYLLRVLQTRSFLQFIVYRVAAGAFVLAYFGF